MSDDSDMAAIGKHLKEESAKRRAKNRLNGEIALRYAEIPFIIKNNGAHFIVTTPKGLVIDYWPGTGLWMVHGNTLRRRGVSSLIRFVKGN